MTETTTTTATVKKTRSMVVGDDVAALLRARNPCLWISTREEARVTRCVAQAAAAAGYVVRTQDVAAGVRELNGKPFELPPTSAIDAEELKDPGRMLAFIEQRSRSTNERCVWIMRGLPVWLQGQVGATVLRAMQNLVHSLPSVVRERAQAIVVITPSAEIPEELSGTVTPIEWPLPDRDEVRAMLDAQLNTLPEEKPEQRAVKEAAIAAMKNGNGDLAVDALRGLTEPEIQASLAKSMVQYKCIDPVAVAAEKKRLITRVSGIEVSDPIPGGLDAVGGLDVMRAWVRQRKSAFGSRARAYGLPMPRAILLVGVPGGGKSWSAKAIATELGIPLVAADINAMKGKFVGQSEGNIRRFFATIKAFGRCVVWFDEIEKAVQGATSGSSDGGTSSDQIGALLKWMQERDDEAFIVMTANNIIALCEAYPEFLRRFDEIFYVDFPNVIERAAIVASVLKQFNRSEVIDCAAVAAACEGYTGAEIAKALPGALYTAFDDGERPITTQDFIDAFERVTPISRTAAEPIAKVRDWIKGRATLATAPVAATAETTARSGRQLDM